MNEVGVRNNPICVDSVDTSEFTDIDGNLILQGVSNFCLSCQKSSIVS